MGCRDDAPEPVEVDFRLADKRIGSMGVIASRDLGRYRRIRAEAEHSVFNLDRAHVRGNEVVTGVASAIFQGAAEPTVNFGAVVPALGA